MLESRESYGHRRGTGIHSDKELSKWTIYYRTNDGGLGQIGELFDTYEKALKRGEAYKAQHEWIESLIIRHPSGCYSNY